MSKIELLCDHKRKHKCRPHCYWDHMSKLKCRQYLISDQKRKHKHWQYSYYVIRSVKTKADNTIKYDHKGNNNIEQKVTMTTYT